MNSFFEKIKNFFRADDETIIRLRGVELQKLSDTAPADSEIVKAYHAYCQRNGVEPYEVRIVNTEKLNDKMNDPRNRIDVSELYNEFFVYPTHPNTVFMNDQQMARYCLWPEGAADSLMHEHVHNMMQHTRDFQVPTKHMEYMTDRIAAAMTGNITHYAASLHEQLQNSQSAIDAEINMAEAHLKKQNETLETQKRNGTNTNMQELFAQRAEQNLLETLETYKLGVERSIQTYGTANERLENLRLPDTPKVIANNKHGIKL